MVRTIGVVCILVIALVVGGCGKSSDGEGSKGESVSVDPFSKKVTIKGADGKGKGEFGEGVKLPAGFPKDVPLHKSGQVVAAFHQGDSFHVSVKTKDSAQKVIDAYSEKMKAEGWSQEQAMDLGAAKMVHFTKEGRKVTVTATTTDDGAMVSITTQKD